jgi:LacI family transcriptional regulator
VTIAQVADRAGVSPTTVSHVLSGKRLVGAETRGAVQAAIRELGYRPNNVARNLRTRRSHMVAVVVPDITNPFYGVLTRGLADAADAAGYGSYVCNTDGLPDREQRLLEDVLDRGADGIVLASGEVASSASLGEGVQTPIVCVGEALDHPFVDLVRADDEVGANAATRHLLARGATRIAMIEGPATGGFPRSEGFRAALQEAGRIPDPRLLVRGDWTRRGGREAMHVLLAGPERPDAVFCANDLMAIGALDAARELGLRVPEDVRIAGFDDIEAASLVSPALTTIANPAYETGRSAGKLLLDRLQHRHSGPRRTVVLPCRLVVRETS